MNRFKSENAPVVTAGETLALSGPALKGLLESVFRKKMPFRFKAGGCSMSPFIKEGDILTVSSLDGSLPKIGEVVIFLHPVSQKPVVHRVVAKKGKTYLIKGDNTLGHEHPLAQEGILGRLDRLERNGERVYFGLGPERLLIAYLARGVWLHRYLRPLWQTVRSRFRKRSI